MTAPSDTAELVKRLDKPVSAAGNNDAPQINAERSEAARRLEALQAENVKQADDLHAIKCEVMEPDKKAALKAGPVCQALTQAAAVIRASDVNAARPRDGSPALRGQEGVALADVPKRLATRPDLDALLTTFVNRWGMDSYDPPAEVVGSVRQIVILALDASRDSAIAEPSGEGVNSNNPTVISPIGKADEGGG